MNLDVHVPADLDQLRGYNSHRAVVGREGLVDLSHFAANGRAFFHQVDKITRVCGIQGSLYSRNAATHDHDGPKDIIVHKITSENLGQISRGSAANA
jgi:hypothetical protein